MKDALTDLFAIRLYLEYIKNVPKLATLEAAKLHFENHGDKDIFDLLCEASSQTPTSSKDFMSHFNIVFFNFCELLLKMDPLTTVRKALDAVKALDN